MDDKPPIIGVYKYPIHYQEDIILVIQLILIEDFGLIVTNLRKIVTTTYFYNDLTI